MKGVQFLVDDQWKVRSVLIDLSVRGEMWENFYNAIAAKQSEKAPSESWDEIKRRIEARRADSK